MLTVIIPAFNEEATVPSAAREIARVLEGREIDYELLFVDDGSKDGTARMIQQAAEENERVRGICFSRNFGKEAAMFAGLEAAKGDCAAVMDCDLQHPPEALLEMYELWEQGYEVIAGVKADRGKESLAYKLSAKTFYKMISGATGIDMAKASDFRLLDRRAVDALLEMPERGVFFRALSSWIGFKTAEVPFEVAERVAGKTKWSLRSLIKYAVRSLVSFTAAPMQIVTVLGVAFFIGALILGIQSLYMKFSGQALGGFTTVILIELIVGAVVMLSLGVIGGYIARIYDEIKCRPRYIISKRIQKKKQGCQNDETVL